MTTALFIGRFQPFHNAHLSDIKKILKECDELVIAIGSSDKEKTKENPFTVEERIRMIEDTLSANNIGNCTIFPVPDIHDDKKWVEHIKTLVPKFDIVYTGNDNTEKFFKQKRIQVKKIKLIHGINATSIRDKMLKNEEWELLVPLEAVKVIEEIKGVERVKGIFKN